MSSNLIYKSIITFSNLQLVPPGADPIMPPDEEPIMPTPEESSSHMELCEPCNNYAPHEICMTNNKSWNCACGSSPSSFDWIPCDCGTTGVAHGSKQPFFTDAEDPRRLPFNDALDYFRDLSGFNDQRVQNLYRNLQIANQIHRCCFTCFKYCYLNLICRFGYPRDLKALKEIFMKDFKDCADPIQQAMDEGYMAIKTDSNSRKRSTINSPFNNAHLNSHAFCPLLMIAQHANMDVKFMAEHSGAVEYIGSYMSKTEEPDFVKIGNIFIKRIAGISRSGKSLTDLQKLNAVGNALIDSQVVGATQMCFLLVGLPFVRYSRPVEVVNPLNQSKIRIKVLGSGARQFVSEEVSALDVGATSQLGKRRAYSEFLKYNKTKFGDYGNVTYYSLRTQYTTKLNESARQSDSKTKRSITELKSLIKIDENSGFIDATSAKSFLIREFRFTRRKKPAVIHFSPHVPINTMDEQSAYMILLMHTIWPDGEEKNIQPEGTTAVAVLSAYNLLPHVNILLGLIQASEKARDEIREDTIANKTGRSLGMFQQSNVAASSDYSSEDELENDTNKLVTIDDGYDAESVHAAAAASADDDIEQYAIDDMRFYSTDDRRLEPSTFHILSVEEHVAAVQFIDQAMAKYRKKQTDVLGDNSGVIHVRPDGGCLRDFGPKQFIPVDNMQERKSKLAATISTFDDEQMLAFKKAKEALSSDSSAKQLIMFVSGEGGTGKSHLINAISEQAAIMFGKTRGKHGSVIKFAPTGSAAFNIGGCTWQSGILKSKYSFVGNSRALKLGEDFMDSVMLIIDEISMVSLEALREISSAICKGLSTITIDPDQKQKIMNSWFGGLHVIFVGDLYQLPAVMQTSVYSSKLNRVAAQKGKLIWEAINYYIRLVTNHRIKQANKLERQFAAALKIFRVGGTAISMINYLNSHNLVLNEADCIAKAHPVQYHLLIL